MLEEDDTEDSQGGKSDRAPEKVLSVRPRTPAGRTLYKGKRLLYSAASKQCVCM